MSWYTPSACHGNYAPVPALTSNTHDHPPSRKGLYDAAMHALDQPHPPSLREILAAYRMKGEEDREMLLAILQAKTAEDHRIAATTKLHQTLLHLNFAPPDDFAPGAAPLPHHIHHERAERPILHPKINDAPSLAVRSPSSSVSAAYNHPPARARTTSRYSPEERRHSSGWSTTNLSPSSGAESVGGENVTYRSPPSVKVKVNATAYDSADSPQESEPRGAGGDRVMSIGTLLSSPNLSYERRGAGSHGMDVDEKEQARQGRKYDER